MMPLAAAVWLGSLAAVTGAQGEPGGIPANESLSVTGSLTYAWHGDPARGCAREGLCGVVGAVVFQPDGGSDAFSGGPGNLEMSGASTVRVRRGVGSGGFGDCVEQSSYADVTLDFPPYGAPIALTPLSSGRCAGPTAQDLARVALPSKLTGRRLRTVDLRGRVPFVAGPFSGELISTILMRPDTSESSSSSSGPASAVSRPPPIPRRLVEFVDLRYAVSSGPGMLDTTFAGTGSPFCDELDSCGVTGSLTASLMPYHETLRIAATRVIAHRVSARRAIADFRAGRVPLSEAVPRSDGLIRLRIGETLTRNGALACADAAVVGGSPSLGPYLTFDAASGGVLGAEVGVATYEPDGTDPGTLRTHCQGPSTSDGLATSQFQPPTLARGVVDPRQLLERQFLVSLAARGRRFHGLGYSGLLGGHLGLSLSLSNIRAGTERLAIP
jgi:hypothetical protein